MPVETPKKTARKDDSFIVDDGVIDLGSDEDDDEKDFSPSFYLRAINNRRRSVLDSQVCHFTNLLLFLGLKIKLTCP